jgi:hypothetical protein
MTPRHNTIKAAMKYRGGDGGIAGSTLRSWHSPNGTVQYSSSAAVLADCYVS